MKYKNIPPPISGSDPVPLTTFYNVFITQKTFHSWSIGLRRQRKKQRRYQHQKRKQ